jgi:hypothetical protein
MSVRYSDADITRLINEEKHLGVGFHSKIRLRDKRGHKEQELDVGGADGSRFRIVLRQSNFNPLDFSVILAFCPAEASQVFRLRRYNGKHEHTNVLEAEKFYAFHVHHATERYQDLGMREDSY